MLPFVVSLLLSYDALIFPGDTSLLVSMRMPDPQAVN